MNVTQEVAKTMAALAANASIPVGMGILHFKAGEHFKAKDFEARADEGYLSLDYVEGRMVKLSMRRDADGSWSVPTQTPQLDYQSWVSRYPTYQALAEAAQKQVDSLTVKLSAHNGVNVGSIPALPTT